MSIYLIGEEGRGGPPFSRAFFSTTLGEMLDQEKKQQRHKLSLFLTDGTTLDVCKIDELNDQYMSVRAYRGEEDACTLTRDIIPYGLIYRVQIAPKEGDEEHIGFTWNPPKADKRSS